MRINLYYDFCLPTVVVPASVNVNAPCEKTMFIFISRLNYPTIIISA